ncbi:MAG: hypothetical protein GYA41_02600 [Bacteroidales bacterium]|nr:hypothetical protein [Bacteroidales bacterium]
MDIRNHPALIKRLKAGLKSDLTGNKANSLIFLHNYGFNIPVTYLVTTHAHELFLKTGTSIFDDLRKELKGFRDISYAIRSSTTAEDSKDFSFAGQFQTLMNIRGTENILTAIRQVWESASLLNDNQYLKRTGISKIKCAVIIQEMISAEIAGVSFSRNPVTNQNETVIEAVEGLGEELVQKGISPLRWRFFKDKIIEGNSDYRYISVIKKVAKDTLRIKHYYGNNIDIEWVYDGKKIYYLQVREITGRKDLNIYSNKMAREMLPGQIKPLVWSVNIPMVNGTWIKLLSEITGPLDIKPEELAKPFYYQTYFNIAALGRIFSKFGMSTDSLEYLMLRDDNSRPSFKPGIKSLKHTFRIIRFVKNKLDFEKTFLKDFNQLITDCRNEEAHLKKGINLENYHSDFSRLFEQGKRLAYLNIVTPMLMSYHHRRLKKQLTKASLDYDKLDFRQDFPELLDYSPLPFMAEINRKLDNLPEPVKEQSVTLEKLQSFREAEEVLVEMDRFLKKFGHLSESGNDFSFSKWEENPEQVFSMIRKSVQPESRAEMYTLKSLAGNGYKIKSSLIKTYTRAGKYKVYREQISSLYIYGYGLFRRFFLNLGKELVKKGIISSDDDIFYLRKEEIDTAVENIISSRYVPCHEIIQKRKKEMEDTKDIVLPQVIYGEEPPIFEKGRIKNHYGTGTSSGFYTGITRVVQRTGDFDSVSKGDVVLIPFSDVSWTPILIKAGAIVSETGGLLSHCSIIAREMGIPALVSVENACAIGNGLMVTVDGSNGILTIHDYE